VIASAHVAQTTEIVLPDGRTVSARPARPADLVAVRGFLHGMSAQSLSLRFFGTPNLDQAAELMVSDAYGDSFALVVVAGQPETVIAHASYVRIDRNRAEVAFLVADAWQGLGIAPTLLRRLAQRAQDEGISRLLADVLPCNHRMLAMFERAGRTRHRHADRDGIEVEIAVSALAPATVAAPPRTAVSS
jgi:RimJ/RimL family protein N-acetyltransferase